MCEFSTTITALKRKRARERKEDSRALQSKKSCPLLNAVAGESGVTATNRRSKMDMEWISSEITKENDSKTDKPTEIRDWTRTCWEEKERWIEDPKRQWHPCPRLANRAVLENSGEYLHAVLSDTLYRRKIFESIKMKLVLFEPEKRLASRAVGKQVRQIKWFRG